MTDTAIRFVGIFAITFAVSFIAYWVTDFFPPYRSIADVFNLAFGFASGSVVTWNIMRWSA